LIVWNVIEDLWILINEIGGAFWQDTIARIHSSDHNRYIFTSKPSGVNQA
jgi:hypothetical protein